MGMKEIVKKDLVDKVMRIANGEKFNYSNCLKVECTNHNMICDVINELDESGNFEDYLDGNGVDQDWSYDMVVKGQGVHMWGSMTDGVMCLLSI